VEKNSLCFRSDDWGKRRWFSEEVHEWRRRVVAGKGTQGGGPVDADGFGSTYRGDFAFVDIEYGMCGFSFVRCIGWL
jgi:hypothetical protein